MNRKLTLKQSDFLSICQVPLNSPQCNLRRGQRMYNKLNELNSRLGDRLRGSTVDPFYLDDRIPAFLMELARFVE